VQLTILTPVYDDWVSLGELLSGLHAVMGGSPWQYDVVVVDDASPNAQPPPSVADTPRPVNCRGVAVLRLCKNLGHQRAIAVGLVYIHGLLAAAKAGDAAVAVMDGDGEDSPSDLPRLLEACAEADFTRIVFARRTRRSETLGFRIGYEAYCLLHRVAVGGIPRVGNFSVVPGTLLEALVVDSNLWNHFAAAVYASRLPRMSLPVPRAKRYSGHSKLNFVGLVVHGFSALACYSETIGVRAVVAAVVLCIISTGAVAAIIALDLLTLHRVPVMAGLTVAAALIISLQALAVALVFSLLTLSRRHDATFLPLRDAPVYILRQQAL
jgi:glycosyltransferase involved in cell wall biosynthesis